LKKPPERRKRFYLYIDLSKRVLLKARHLSSFLDAKRVFCWQIIHLSIVLLSLNKRAASKFYFRLVKPWNVYTELDIYVNCNFRVANRLYVNTVNAITSVESLNKKDCIIRFNFIRINRLIPPSFLANIALNGLLGDLCRIYIIPLS
jgi:hypothetical protein